MWRDSFWLMNDHDEMKRQLRKRIRQNNYVYNKVNLTVPTTSVFASIKANDWGKNKYSVHDNEFIIKGKKNLPTNSETKGREITNKGKKKTCPKKTLPNTDSYPFVIPTGYADIAEWGSNQNYWIYRPGLNPHLCPSNTLSATATTNTWQRKEAKDAGRTSSATKIPEMHPKPSTHTMIISKTNIP